jgi:ribosomal protein S18 acetylase RimI-like enzyme
VHLLDRPIWNALQTRQVRFADGGDLSQRFPAAVSPFVAMRDFGPAAAKAAAAQIGDGEEISMLEPKSPEPPLGVSTRSLPILQMVARGFSGWPSKAFSIQPLGDADAAEMLALATLTKPGPFRTRTHTMGRFLGVRDGGKLIAMAGERLHVPGYREISAVCTHPDWQGRGMGAALIQAVGLRMLQEGDRPFLHTYASNTGAIALYNRLGFDVRADLVHVMWTRP